MIYIILLTIWICHIFNYKIKKHNQMTKSKHNFNSLYHIILYQIYQLIKRKNKNNKKKKKNNCSLLQSSAPHSFIILLTYYLTISYCFIRLLQFILWWCLFLRKNLIDLYRQSAELCNILKALLEKAKFEAKR